MSVYVIYAVEQQKRLFPIELKQKELDDTNLRPTMTMIHNLVFQELIGESLDYTVDDAMFIFHVLEKFGMAVPHFYVVNKHGFQFISALAEKDGKCESFDRVFDLLKVESIAEFHRSAFHFKRLSNDPAKTYSELRWHQVKDDTRFLLLKDLNAFDLSAIENINKYRLFTNDETSDIINKLVGLSHKRETLYTFNKDDAVLYSKDGEVNVDIDDEVDYNLWLPVTKPRCPENEADTKFDKYLNLSTGVVHIDQFKIRWSSPTNWYLHCRYLDDNENAHRIVESFLSEKLSGILSFRPNESIQEFHPKGGDEGFRLVELIGNSELEKDDLRLLGLDYEILYPF